jgi:hypothetical protein
MEHKRIITPLVLAALFVAFAIVSFIVWLRKRKPERWISRKMKLGAAIITLTTISTGCPPEITCYDPVAENLFVFDSMDQNNYLVLSDLPEDSVITGKIYEPTFDHYRFEIETLDSQLIEQGPITPFDGAFDLSVEDFKLVINSLIDTGNYRMSIFSSSRGNNENSFKVFQVGLRVK